MDDDIKISIMLYLGYWSDFQISKLSLGDKTKICNGRSPQNIKYRMRGKSEENLEEILSVALLNPACLLFSLR